MINPDAKNSNFILNFAYIWTLGIKLDFFSIVIHILQKMDKEIKVANIKRKA